MRGKPYLWPNYMCLFRLGDYVLSYFKGIEEYVIVILFSIPRGASNKPQTSFFIVKIML